MLAYRPQVDWGGEGGSATIVLGGRNVKVATAGWRRRCLFLFLFSLLVIAILNLVLTLWILKEISFNAEGAGDLEVQVGGLKLEGNFFLKHGLTVGKIRSQPETDLNVTGFFNISLFLVDKENEYNYMFSLDPVAVSATTEAFSIFDQKGLLLFSVDRNETKVGAKYFTVTGDEGAKFEGSMQTPRLLGSANEFRIESKTRSLKGSAGSLLRVDAPDGDVNVISLKDIQLNSKNGKIRFENRNVFFSNLATFGEENASTPPTLDDQIESPSMNPVPTQPYVDESGFQQNTYLEDISIYQVCVCPSGRLFLVPSENIACENDPLACQ